MLLAGAGQLYVGNTTPKTQRIELKLTVLSPAPGYLLTIMAPDGSPLLKDAALSGSPGILEVPPFPLPPGAQLLSFHVKSSSLSGRAELFVNSIEIRQAPALEPQRQNREETARCPAP
jgi:hypothetical protein